MVDQTHDFKPLPLVVGHAHPSYVYKADPIQGRRLTDNYPHSVTSDPAH